MNAYYQQTDIKSNKNYLPQIHTGDKLISFICAVVAFLTSNIAAAVEKILLCTFGFFGFFGVIGSIENGTLGLAVGVILCFSIAFIEYAVMRSIVKKIRR